MPEPMTLHYLRRFDSVPFAGGRVTLYRVDGRDAAHFYCRDRAGNNRHLLLADSEEYALPGLPGVAYLSGCRGTDRGDGWAVLGLAPGDGEPVAAMPSRLSRQCFWCDMPALGGKLTCGREGSCPEHLARVREGA